MDLLERSLQTFFILGEKLIIFQKDKYMKESEGKFPHTCNAKREATKGEPTQETNTNKPTVRANQNNGQTKKSPKLMDPFDIIGFLL